MLNLVRRGVILALINTAVAVLISLAIFGWHTTTEAMGGVKSFGALLGLFVGIIVVAGGLIYMAMHDYSNSLGAMVRDLIIAFAIIMIIGVVGFRWVHLPDESAMHLLLALGLVIVQTVAAYLLFGWRRRPAA